MPRRCEGALRHPRNSRVTGCEMDRRRHHLSRPDQPPSRLTTRSLSSPRRGEGTVDQSINIDGLAKLIPFRGSAALILLWILRIFSKLSVYTHFYANAINKGGRWTRSRRLRCIAQREVAVFIHDGSRACHTPRSNEFVERVGAKLLMTMHC